MFTCVVFRKLISQVEAVQKGKCCSMWSHKTKTTRIRLNSSPAELLLPLVKTLYVCQVNTVISAISLAIILIDFTT